MKELDSIIELFFGWGFVVGAIFLFFVILAVIRSSKAFKNSKIVKGKIVAMGRYGDNYLPTIEFNAADGVHRFRYETKQEGLEVDKEVDVELGRSNDVRLYEEGKVDKLPKMVYFVMLLFFFFLLKGIFFLKTIFV